MKLKLKAIPPLPPAPVYKASVHKTGKIGFTIETAKKFGITTDKSMELLVNEDDTEDKNIYGIIKEIGDANGYKIMKAGEYHSVNAKGFFETLKLDYSDGSINYIIMPIEVDGVSVLKFEFSKKEPEPVLGNNITDEPL